MTDYTQDLAIDPSALDEEWMAQPVLMMRYGDLTAAAQKERDQIKERLDVVRAEQDNAIREHPERYNCPTDKTGLPKPTEAWISSAILKTEDYRAASDALIEANYKFNLLQSAVRAFEHRKKALEKLAELFISQYWATPGGPRQIKAGKRMGNPVTDETERRVRRRISQ